jgi:hypothetical protein
MRHIGVGFCISCLGTQDAGQQSSANLEIEMPPPLALGDLPPALAHTLQHIVSKMDMMTQVIGMVEERLSLNEDKLSQMQQQLHQLLPIADSPAAEQSQGISQQAENTV